MAQYRVVWEIDIDAASPKEAAEKAQAYQQKEREGYWIGVFTVTNSKGRVLTVDLADRRIKRMRSLGG